MTDETGTPRPARIRLEFDPALARPDETRGPRDNLSVAVRTGDDLWLASDEGAMLERLSRDGDDRFAHHRRFALADYLDLPGDADGEVDVEGIGFEDGWLWLTGSHGLKRKKPKRKRSLDEQVERLATVKRDPNRYLLARIPCVRGPDGRYALHRRDEQGRVAGALHAKGTGNDLTHLLRDDPHLAPFLDIPGKDNGFDVEGLAVHGATVLVGLRGPVLRGYAVVLALDLVPDDDAPAELRLRGYRKHFLDLAGMGVRELRVRGDDVLILAGPTMTLDGTIALWRWPGGPGDADDVVHADRLERLFAVPHAPGADRAEGLSIWDERHVLVVYDTPSAHRLAGAHGVYADRFPLPD